MTPRGDRRGDHAARRLRAALRQALRGHARRSASTGPFTVESLSPHRSARRPTTERAGAETQAAAATPTRRRSSRRSSTTSARPASRTASGRAARRSTVVEPYAGDVHPGRRRPRGRADGAPTRVGDLHRPAVRHGRRRRSSRTPPARRSRAPDLDLLLRPRLRLRPAACSTPARTSSPPTRASTSPPSGRSAASRCCWCG